MTHELVRHRPPNYSQTSTRYVDYAKGGSSPNLDRFEMNVIVPPHQNPEQTIKLEDGQQLTPQDMVAEMEKFYRALRKHGWPPEDTRQLLPIGIEAPIITTSNLNKWRYIFSKHVTKTAHWEIRNVMIKSLLLIKKEFSDIFSDFVLLGKDENDLPYYGLKQ